MDLALRIGELLLSSGAPITEVNAVRKHVSALKGGRLAARIAPATLVNLTASDVAGDVLDAITDPTVQDGSTVADAITDRRLQGAHRLLLATDLPVSSIGYRCGYSNNASFTRAFSRRFGMAPTRLRAIEAAA